MLRLLTPLCLALPLVSHLSAAQTPATLVEGQRLRVAHRCRVAQDRVIECRAGRSPHFDEGHLQSVRGDTLHLRVQGIDAALAIPKGSITQVWVADGKRGNFWNGAAIGLVAGATLGAVIGSGTEYCFWDSCSPATGLGALIGAPAGALLGGFIGSQIQSDRWRRVPLGDRHLSVESGWGTIGLGVSVAF